MLLRISRRYSSFVEIAPNIRDALLKKSPIVALESTIISHGMPHPRNLEVARAVEAVVRKAGAVPATIGILSGRPVIGLDDQQLQTLAQPQSKSFQVHKCSRRDLAFLCVLGKHASTTVASTAYLASLVGIRVFATGGLGGVHRGAEVTMDVSADLFELSRTPVTVVSSGIKSILDIPKTLEVLESYGVPVLTYQSDIFPAFFTNNSGIASQFRVDSASEVARMMECADALNMTNGMVVAVPNPSPAEEGIHVVIEYALRVAESSGVSGAALTPFLLQHIHEATSGTSLDANAELILHNAKIAAEIAVAYAQRPPVSVPLTTHTTVAVSSRAVPPALSAVEEQVQVLCVGAAVVDSIGIASGELVPGSSNPGALHVSFGGVARNVAEAVARLGGRPALASAVGGDSSGAALIAHAQEAGVVTTRVQTIPARRTATYTAIHDKTGDLTLGLADMDIIREEVGLKAIVALSPLMNSKNVKVVVSDGNLSPEAFLHLAKMCRLNRVPFIFDGTSDHKCLLPLQASALHYIDIIKPNMSELRLILSEAVRGGLLKGDRKQKVEWMIGDDSLVSVDVDRSLAVALYALLTYEGSTSGISKHVIVSMGAQGIVWVGPTALVYEALAISPGIIVDNHGANTASVWLPPAPISSAEVVNASGAGDCFVAGLAQGLCVEGQVSVSVVQRALAAARASLTALTPVPATRLTD